MKKPIIVRPATEDDLDAVARINSRVFLGNRDDYDAALQWVRCCYRSYPIVQYFCSIQDNRVAGYCSWKIHGGLRRPSPAIELVELGVDPDIQARGHGTALTNFGLEAMARWTASNNRRIESQITFIVWCYASNLNAIKVYVNTFGEGAGFRIQHEGRTEVAYRKTVSLVLQDRDE